MPKLSPTQLRSRLRRISEITGLSPTDPREAFTLRVALVLGRLASDDIDAL